MVIEVPQVHSLGSRRSTPLGDRVRPQCWFLQGRVGMTIKLLRGHISAVLCWRYPVFASTVVLISIFASKTYLRQYDG